MLSASSLLTPFTLQALLILLGILLGWLLYQFGFRGLKLPTPLPDSDKAKHSQFYTTTTLEPTQLGGWNVFMLAACILALLVLLTGILFVLQARFPTEIRWFARFAFPATCLLMLAGIGFLYTRLILAHRQGRLSPEIQGVWEKTADRWILAGGSLVFFLIASLFLWQNKLSLIGFLLGIFLLPIVLLVSRVEGRFFFLFLLQEVSRARNWDLLEGQPLHTPKQRGIRSSLGGAKRLQACIAVFSAISGILTIPFVTSEFFLGPLIQSPTLSFQKSWFQQGGMALVVLLLSLGPLATLATRPFGFLNVWLNQRLYEQIVSPWDIQTMNQNIVRWGHVVRLPQPVREEGFAEGIALAGGGILALISLSLTSRMATTYGVIPPDSLLKILFDTLEILQLSSFFVLLASIIQHLIYRVETQTAWLFAQEGRKARMDLINHSLYGLHWIRCRWQEQDWIQKTPPSWGLPLILFGLNDHPNLPRKAQLEGMEKAVHLVLPPMMKPVAWQQLGSFLIKQNRHDEARKAFETGLEQFPTFANLWSNMIQIHMQDHNEDKAFEAYTQAITHAPHQPNAYANWGTYLAQQERWAEAETVFLLGIDRCKQDGLLLFNMALTLAKQGKDDQAEQWFRRTVKTDPSQTQAWLILADTVRDQGHLDEAETYYRKGIEFDPHNADAWQGLGEIMLRTKRYQDAEKILRKAVTFDPNHAVAWNNLAVALRELEQPDEAVEAFRTALEKDPSMLITWETLAQLFCMYGIWAEAESTLRGAIHHFPQQALLYRNLALAIRQQGRLDEALTIAQKAANLDPNNPEIQSYLAELEAGEGLLEGVEVEESEMPEDPEDPEAWSTWAQHKFMEGRWGEAEQGMNRAIHLQPNNPQLWAILGDILNQQGRPGEAETAYKTALSRDPKHIGAQINLAVAFTQQQKMAEAEQAYRDAIAIDPTILSPWTYLFYMTSQAGEWDKCLALHQEALQHLPESPEIWFSYGYQLARLRRMEEAESVLKQGLLHAPDHLQMRTTLGDVLFHLDKREESAQTFRQVTEQDPENVGAWLKLATVEMKSMKLVEADDAYRHAIALHPDWTEALFNLAMINTALGRFHDAFQFIDQTLASNPDMLSTILQQPDFEPLHSDPRWNQLQSTASSS